MAILLTGASGFVGAFVQRQITCIAFDYAGQQVDLRDAGQVRSAIEQFRPEGVIHLAGQSFVPASFDDPRETYDINFFGTLNLLDALKESGFRGRMLFVGSGDMYGLVPETRLPITEDLPPRPRSPYAVSKVAAEALCYQWSQMENFCVGDDALVQPYRARPERAIRGVGFCQAGDRNQARASQADIARGRYRCDARFHRRARRGGSVRAFARAWRQRRNIQCVLGCRTLRALDSWFVCWSWRTSTHASNRTPRACVWASNAASAAVTTSCAGTPVGNPP